MINDITDYKLLVNQCWKVCWWRRVQATARLTCLCLLPIVLFLASYAYTTTYSSIATDCGAVPVTHLLQQDTLELQLE